jgi:hypothetical protein
LNGRKPAASSAIALGYMFHGPECWALGQLLAGSEFESGLEEHVSKCDYLREKFFAPRGRRLYLYKPQYTMPTEKVERLAELLAEISPGALMVLFRISHHTSSNATHPMICERAIGFHAPSDAMIEGDTASWDAVFAEFPHRDLIHAQIGV